MNCEYTDVLRTFSLHVIRTLVLPKSFLTTIYLSVILTTDRYIVVKSKYVKTLIGFTQLERLIINYA